MSDDLSRLDATAQAELVRSGEASAVELVDAAISRIEKLNPQLNAVIHELFDRARVEAAGELPDGPFRGVPFLLKDFAAELEGTPFSEGTRLSGDYVSTHTQELTRRFQAAGLVICGKTNTPEFGILPTTEPQRFGPTRNPWDPTRTTGGSSGGSAAAVASGMVPDRPRQRRGRLDPHPGLVLRSGGPEAVTGPGDGGPAVRRHHGRPGGRARGEPHRARFGGGARRHRRAHAG